MLVVNDEDSKITGKNFHEKLSNTEFALNKNMFSRAVAVSGISILGVDGHC